MSKKKYKIKPSETFKWVKMYHEFWGEYPSAKQICNAKGVSLNTAYLAIREQKLMFSKIPVMPLVD